MERMNLKLRIMLAVTVVVAATTIAGFMIAPTLSQQEAEEKTIYVEIALAPLKIPDLSKDSTHIIIGTVADTMAGPTQYDERRSTTRAFTDVVINVERDLAGTYKEDQITLRTIGGMVGDVKIEADNEAKFANNERVVVFVNHADSNTMWGDSFVVYGRELGKYSVTDGKAYGSEYPEGIQLEEFEEQIKMYRNQAGG